MAWDLYTDGITQSLLFTYLSCPQKLKHKYVSGLKSKKQYFQKAMEFGTIFHFCSEQFNGLDNRIELLSGQKSQLKVEVNALVDALSKKQMDEVFSGKSTTSMGDILTLEELYCGVRPLLFHYLIYWKDWLLETQWKSLEREFEVQHTSLLTGKKIPLRGKIDGEIQRKKVWHFETKTKSSLDLEEFMNKLQYDLQSFMYMYAIYLETGEYPGGYVYNMLKRPMLRKKEKETYEQYSNRIEEDICSRPTEYFSMLEVTFDKTAFDQWLNNDFYPLILNLERTVLEQSFIKNPLSCKQYNKHCPFLQLCGNLSSESDYDVNTTVFGELSEYRGFDTE